MIRLGLRPTSSPLAFPALLALIACSGCAQKYSRHMSETYKEKKIDAGTSGNAVTFGVIELPELSYDPPSNCMSGGNKGDGTKYRAEWDALLMKKLSGTFKKQRFVSIPAERLEEIGISAPTFQSRAEQDIEKMGVVEYEAQGGSVRPIEYLPASASSQMREWGMKLKEKDSIDYIIALVDPKMKGEVHTSYNAGAGAGGVGGGMSSTTVYTSNARFGIWSTETGELAYASGSIAASSGFCIFMSPQSMSLDGNTGDMSTQLKALITAFLNRLPAERLEVGQASFSAPEAAPQAVPAIP